MSAHRSFACSFLHLVILTGSWSDLDLYPQESQWHSAAIEAIAHLKNADRIMSELPAEYQDFVKNSLADDWKAEERSHDELPKSRSGVVIVAGGAKGSLYIPLVYVGAAILRKTGCQWPIELWHFDYQLTRWHKALFKSIGVRLRDLEDVLQNEELKSPWTYEMMRGFGAWRNLPIFAVPFAAEQTDFEVVVLLNADFIPMTNVCQDSIWDTPDGLHGPTPSALVFPDHFNLSKTRYFPSQWERLGVPLPADEQPEAEVGIVVIDKKACPTGMRLLFDVVRENQRIRAEEGEEVMEDHFYGENSMWRPIWAKAGCHCALGQYPEAIAGFSIRNDMVDIEKNEHTFQGVGKISRGFSDGRMLGLHYQWGKSLTFFRQPHPAMFPLHPRVEIGTGFAHAQWWDMLSGAQTLDYIGWASGEWAISLGCDRPHVPCEERNFYEWEGMMHLFRDAWAEAFAF